MKVNVLVLRINKTDNQFGLTIFVFSNNKCTTFPIFIGEVIIDRPCHNTRNDIFEAFCIQIVVTPNRAHKIRPQDARTVIELLVIVLDHILTLEFLDVILNKNRKCHLENVTNKNGFQVRSTCGILIFTVKRFQQIFDLFLRIAPFQKTRFSQRKREEVTTIAIISRHQYINVQILFRHFLMRIQTILQFANCRIIRKEVAAEINSNSTWARFEIVTAIVFVNLVVTSKGYAKLTDKRELASENSSLRNFVSVFLGFFLNIANPISNEFSQSITSFFQSVRIDTLFDLGKDQIQVLQLAFGQFA